MTTIDEIETLEKAIQQMVLLDKIETHIRKIEGLLNATDDYVLRLKNAIRSVDVLSDDWCPFCREHPSHGHRDGCIYVELRQ